MYRSTFSLTSALGEVGGQRHDPAALPPGKTRNRLYRRLCGLVRMRIITVLNLVSFSSTIHYLLYHGDDIFIALLRALRTPAVCSLAQLLHAVAMQLVTERLIFRADLWSEVFIQVACRSVILWAETFCSF
jgi:hypothetical protein